MIFVLYYLNVNNNLFYLDIGYNDNYNNLLVNKYNINNYSFKYNKNDYRITDVINMINNNIKIDNSTIQNDLVKANLITVQTGVNDLVYSSFMNKNDIKEIEDDIVTLFTLLRSITKEKIIFIGIYNKDCLNINNSLLYNLNNFIKNKCLDYDIIYLDVLSSFNNISCDNDLIDKVNNYIVENMKNYL